MKPDFQSHGNCLFKNDCGIGSCGKKNQMTDILIAILNSKILFLKNHFGTDKLGYTPELPPGK